MPTNLRVLLALGTLPLLSQPIEVGIVDSSVHGATQQLVAVLDAGLDELLLVHVLHGAMDLLKARQALQYMHRERSRR
jgi:hypothetical protein